ncbi:MAG: hypothetical protein KAY32_09115 [Candidatus Eisenbacteria sp.]|nr:hypothetical protein [Candidatus Eisenbacteria bacterium]
MRRGIAGLAATAIVLGALLPTADAVSFETQATLGDRRVELQWMPDGDDPLYTGNLKLFALDSTQLAAGEIGHLVFDRFGDQLWAIDRHASLVARLTRADVENEEVWELDALLEPLSGSPEVLTAALHPAGHLLLVGLADGTLAAWRPSEQVPVEIFAGHDGACRAIAFGPQAAAGDSSFVSVGDDGRLVRWSRPGVISREVLVSAAGLTAAEVAASGEEVAVGDAAGAISTWTLLASFEELISIPSAHSSGRVVTGLTYSADGRRLASADAEGSVRLWDSRFGLALGSYDPPSPDPITIGFTPRQSLYIPYAHASGQLGVLDGLTCLPYDIREELNEPLSVFAVTPDGRITFLATSDGRLQWWFQGRCVPSPVTPNCFGGYILWRGVSVDSLDLVRLRVYQFGDTTWQWTTLDTMRTFVDPDSIIPRGGDPDGEVAGPHNGIPYYYCIVKFYEQFRNGMKFEVWENTREEGCYRTEPGGDPAPLIARPDARTETPLLDRVYVVPDPYVANDPLAQFGPSSPPLVRFVELPAEATIRIYTVSGDLVRTLEHFEVPSGEHGGTCTWDLRNDHRKAVASGVYIYAIETPPGESATGFLTLVR